jgi:hypothetical protein
MRNLVFHTEGGSYVFQDWLLRKTFGPMKDEATGEWNGQRNEELHDLYSTAKVLVGKP